MKAVTGREFAKILVKKGWKLLRINGSHHIYGKEGCKAKISLPVHKNQNLKTGLLLHLMKIADILEEEL